jgi:hypothetical protein
LKNSSMLLLTRNSVFCTSRRLTRKGDLLNKERFSIALFCFLFLFAPLLCFLYAKLQQENTVVAWLCQPLASMKPHFIYTLDPKQWPYIPTTNERLMIGWTKCEGRNWLAPTGLDLNCYRAWYLTYVYRLSALSEGLSAGNLTESHQRESGHLTSGKMFGRRGVQTLKRPDTRRVRTLKCSDTKWCLDAEVRHQYGSELAQGGPKCPWFQHPCIQSRADWTIGQW